MLTELLSVLHFYTKLKCKSKYIFIVAVYPPRLPSPSLRFISFSQPSPSFLPLVFVEEPHICFEQCPFEQAYQVIKFFAAAVSWIFWCLSV